MFMIITHLLWLLKTIFIIPLFKNYLWLINIYILLYYFTTIKLWVFFYTKLIDYIFDEFQIQYIF